LADTDGDGVSDGQEVIDGTDPLHAPQLVINSLTITRPATSTTATFTVTLLYPIKATALNTVTVHYNTIDGTAISTGPQGKHDYEAASGTLTFSTATQSIVITIENGTNNGQQANSLNEFFSVVLSSAAHATITTSTGTGTFTP
jgi:hypothetical protein